MVSSLKKVELGVERASTSWDVMHQQATTLVKSGFLPDSIRTPEQAIAIMLTGEELGIPKMLALRSINVIKGKPTLSADLMAGLVQREIDRHGDGEFTVMPPTADQCTVIFRRWNEEGVRQFVYTMEDAKRAGLTNNANYQRHPGAMLRARATSTAARMGFPDVVAGLYAPEELDADEPARVIEIVHGLDMNADDLPERQTEEFTRRLLETPEVAALRESIATEEAEAIDADTGQIDTAETMVPRSTDPLEQARLDAWGLAKDLGYDWAHFTATRKRLKLPLLEKMTASQARLITDEYREMGGNYEDVRDAEWQEMPLDED